MAASKKELTAWRDKGYDDASKGLVAAEHAPKGSKERAAYFEGSRGYKRAAANGDGLVSAQRERRPRVA